MASGFGVERIEAGTMSWGSGCIPTITVMGGKRSIRVAMNHWDVEPTQGPSRHDLPVTSSHRHLPERDLDRWWGLTFDLGRMSRVLA